MNKVASGANVDSDAVPPSVEDEHELEIPSASLPLRVSSKPHNASSPLIPEESRSLSEPPDTQTCVLYDELYNLLPEFREFCDRRNNGEPVDDDFNLEAAGCAQLEGDENNGTGFHSNFSQALEVQSTGNTVVDLVKAIILKPTLIHLRRFGGPLDCLMCERHRPTHERALALTAEIHLLDKIHNRLERRQWHLLQRAHNAGGDLAEDEL
ncbi:hypothetical protein H0H92_012500 [Tricholoma furcatifolium]|nr:hypothetical protein H0H92_012500 [Tricholoma furcatifolium]